MDIQVQARWTPALIGLTYLVFGIGAMVDRGPEPHFALFIVLGLLLLAGVWVWSPAQKSPQ